MNDWLATAFGDEATVQALRPSDDSADGASSVEGVGRLVTLRKAVPLDELVAKMKSFLGLQHGDSICRRLAWD